MRKYIVRRLLLGIPTLLIMSLFIFGILRLLPGDIATYILMGSGATGGAGIDQASVERLREDMGLNRPAHIQYLTWLWSAVRGDLGDSLLTKTSVGGDILYRIPLTFQLGLMAMGLGFSLGIPVGIISAIKQNSWLDLLLRFWSIFFLAAPHFWLGLIVLLVGLRLFGWVPPMGHNFLWENPKDNLLQLIFPALIMATSTLAFTARMTRSTMLEVIREDYIRTARAKGLAENVVIFRHALRNALIPIVTIAGNYLGVLIGGTIIMEIVFSIPGMGLYFIEAIQLRDFPVIQGVVIILATAFILINLAVDLLYAWLDPRITYS